MSNEQYPHLTFDGFYRIDTFTPLTGGGNKKTFKDRNRNSHGNSLREQFQSAVSEFRAEWQDEDIIYVEFESEPGFNIPTDSFDSARNYFKVAYSKIVSIQIEDEIIEVQQTGVYVSTIGVEKFLKKIEDYLNPEKNTTKGNPRNQYLINNISNIRAATFKGFWTEPTQPFPDIDEDCWWEVWFRKDNETDIPEFIEEINELFEDRDSKIGEISRGQPLVFPEHIVLLIKGTARELSQVLFKTNCLSELRKPKDLASFILNETRSQQQETLDNILDIIEEDFSSNTYVCLIDSGVNRGHPLLGPYLSNEDMFTLKKGWGTADEPVGPQTVPHGTSMAGNILFGDLSSAIASGNVQLFHRLESVKIIDSRDPHEEPAYGSVTIQAVLLPDFEDRKRIYCMAVTASNTHNGEPSSWSSAVDELIFGDPETQENSKLMLISAGNVSIEMESDYPELNHSSPVQDPAQAANAIVLGGYTELDHIDQSQFPDSESIALRGTLSPRTTTGIEFDTQWANKPDIVFEAGNQGVQNDDLIDPESLSVLTTAPDFNTNAFSINHSTSLATALASNFCGELYSKYSEYRPETIRALLIHSAEWVDQMNTLSSTSKGEEKLKLLRTYGYGVPRLEQALFSASDNLTLVAERTIQPFIKVEGSSNPTINECHVFELPWPKEALEALFDTEVRITITLSYFIEPNPGRKVYSQSHSYYSHGLRFKLSRPNEPLDRFRARLNKKVREAEFDGNFTSDVDRHNWALGPTVREKGTIQKDWQKVTGADLATMDKIAVYPVSGWWAKRKNLKRYDLPVHYSLIVSIDSPEVDIDVDLYTPVKTEIEQSIDIST